MTPTMPPVLRKPKQQRSSLFAKRLSQLSLVLSLGVLGIDAFAAEGYSDSYKLAQDRQLRSLVETYTKHTTTPGLFRSWCTRGIYALRVPEDRAKGIASPDAGDLCLALLFRAADIQAGFVRQDLAPRVQPANLLSLYRFIAEDTMFAAIETLADEETTRKILTVHLQFSERPDARDATVGELPIRSKPGQKITFTPGAAFDSSFSSTVLEILSARSTSETRTVAVEIEPRLATQIVEACFQSEQERTRRGATIGKCAEAGRIEARRYLVSRGLLQR
jgi:hypothetical protein